VPGCSVSKIVAWIAPAVAGFGAVDDSALWHPPGVIARADVREGLPDHPLSATRPFSGMRPGSRSECEMGLDSREDQV